MSWENRKPRRSQKIRNKAREMGKALWGDHDWALVESTGIETPVGLVHLHRMNRYGRAWWNLTSKSYKGICETSRCRVVYIIPLGGENESAPPDAPSIGEVQEAYWRARYALEQEEYPVTIKI